MNEEFDLQPQSEETAPTEEEVESPSGELSADEESTTVTSPETQQPDVAKELEATRAELARIKQDQDYQRYQAEQARQKEAHTQAEQARAKQIEQQRLADIQETKLVMSEAERLRAAGHDDAASDLLLRYGARKEMERMTAVLPAYIQEQVNAAFQAATQPARVSNAFQTDPRTANIRHLEDVALSLVSQGYSEEQAIARCEEIAGTNGKARAKEAKSQALASAAMESVDAGSPGSISISDKEMDKYIDNLLGLGKQRGNRR